MRSGRRWILAAMLLVLALLCIGCKASSSEGAQLLLESGGAQ